MVQGSTHSPGVHAPGETDMSLIPHTGDRDDADPEKSHAHVLEKLRETDHNLCRDLSKTAQRIKKLQTLADKVSENLQKELELESSLKDSMEVNDLNAVAMVKRIQFDDHYEKQDLLMARNLALQSTPLHWRQAVEKLEKEKKLQARKQQRMINSGKS